MSHYDFRFLPPTQIKIPPLYTDNPDWHTHAAALFHLIGEDFTALCTKVLCLASGTRPTMVVFSELPPFATAEDVRDALLDQSFSVGYVFQLSTRRRKTNLWLVCL
ncbi:hypothetical protein J6590_091266 [Homalodisca vitripennis]|nr:hypothetical protein J6590_091266 [Homalodisca vitripennis]